MGGNRFYKSELVYVTRLDGAPAVVVRLGEGHVAVIRITLKDLERLAVELVEAGVRP